MSKGRRRKPRQQFIPHTIDARFVTTSDDDSPVYAHLSSWEYGCCGETPAIGATITASLVAYPAADDEQFPAAPVIDWDRKRELAVFPTCSARFDPEYGDPRGARLRLYASRHESSAMIPEIEAEIVDLYEASVVHDRTGGSVIPVPGSDRFVKVTAVERFPAPGQLLGTPGLRDVTGVVMGLAVISVREPTIEDVGERDVAAERAARTIIVTGPAAAFGQSVPARDQHISLDLTDPRLKIEGALSDLRRTVRGTTGQVSVMTYGGGWATLGNIPAGTPTDEVGKPLFVALTIDADDL